MAAGPLAAGRPRPNLRPEQGTPSINAITVPKDSGDELAKRFAARAGAVDNQEGFEGFELLRPTDERTTWLVVTRWRDEEAFQAWVGSQAFSHGHARPEGDGPALAMTSELWSYEPAAK